MACIINCCKEEHCSLKESKNLHRECVDRIMCNINVRNREIKLVKEERGFYVIEFMDNVDNEGICKLINALDKEASMRGIYLSRRERLLKLKVPMVVDISSLEKFIEKLEEFVAKI